jgi:hypothetical protein
VYEVIPLVLGAALGAATLTLAPGGSRWAAQIAGALVIGTAVAVGTGEAGENPLFIAFDTAQALVACLLTALLLTRAGVGWARRD